MNTIPIKSWSGDQDDKELQKLIPYLEKLVHAVSFLHEYKLPKNMGTLAPVKLNIVATDW